MTALFGEEEAPREDHQNDGDDHQQDRRDAKGITQQNVFQRIKGVIDVGENKLDYVAAALDLGTSYFEHTGIQTVTRRLVSRAYGEI